MFRALELFGFKTFASRTRFEFQGEVTAVIGPNGSGKSNLADAVRWVLAEPAGRGLRVRKAEDLIFLGGGGRAPAGFAEATIVLDNRNRSLPLDFDEVTVTRRLHRAGDSEYWLNGSRVRQREIIEALSRAGIAQSSYSVIGQGMIDAALSLRPEERRELIEEAADVRRHQLSLSDAQTKLAATRTNLQRLDDILTELGPRVERLRQQAAEATEHRRLAAELAGLLSGAYVVRWKQTVARMRDAAERVRNASLAAAAVRDQQQVAADDVTAARQQTAAIRQRHEQIVNDLRAAEAAADRARHESAYAIRTVDRLAEDLERLTAEAAEHRQRTEHEAASLSEAERQRDTVRTEIATLSAARNQQRAGQLDLEQAAKSATTKLGELQRALSRTEAEAGSAALMAERLAEDLAGRGTPPAPKPDELDETARVMQELHAAVDAEARLGRQVTLAGEQRTAAQARQTALEEQQAARKIEAAGVAERLREIERRLTMLANEDAAGDGLFPAVRLVLERAGRMAAVGAGRRGSVAERPALQGIIGAVAELIETPAGYERAFEAALGGRSQDIVVERWADAEMAIRLLRESGGGRATFLPLDTVQPGRIAVWPREPGVHGVASDLCTVDERYRPVVERLLGNWIIVDDLDVARRCLRGGGRGQQFVTLQGDTVSSWGAVTGGSNPTRRDGLWRRRAERTTLSGERATLLTRQSELAAELGRLAEDTKEARYSAATHAAELVEREHERAAAARVIGQLQARLDRAEAAEKERQQAAERAEAQRAALQRQIAELAERRKALDQRLAKERQAVAEAAKVADEAGQRAAVARGGETELASRLAGLQAAAQAADAALKRAHDTRQREAELASRATAREQEISAQLADARAEAKHHHQAASHHLERAGALQQEAAAVSEQLRQAEAALVRLTDAERQGWEAVAAENEKLAEARRQEESAAEAMETLRRRIETDGLIPEDIAAMPAPDIEITEAERRITRLRARLRSLPNVSYRVIEEFDEENARLAHLSAQAEDLRAAEANLSRTITALEAMIAQRFEQTVAAVNVEFKAFFHRLFGGGTARLGLGDTAGIEIEAHPPGKKPQSLALLSGGERAMTAAALIFALLKVNPIPFCVLDEVDAALDETNVRRFIDVLQELAALTQFVVITHNRVTVEAATAVYGLASAADGSTRVLSIRLRDGEPAEKQPA